MLVERSISMAEHPNAELHRKGHEAFTRLDMDTLAELFAEDTVWHMPGRSQVSGDLVGREAVFGFFNKLGELSDGSLAISEEHDFLGTDDHSVALFRVTAQRNNKTLESNLIEVVHWRNGQIVENWTSFEDQYAWDEFWS